MAFRKNISCRIAFVDGFEDVIVTAFDADHDFIEAVFFNPFDVVDGLVLNVVNRSVGCNAGVRIVAAHEIPYGDLLVCAEDKGVATRGPNILDIQLVALGPLQVGFDLLQRGYTKRRAFVKITKCTCIMGTAGCDFNKQAIDIGLGPDYRTMKVHRNISF